MPSQYPDQTPFVPDQTIQDNQFDKPQRLSADLPQMYPATKIQPSPSLPPTPPTVDGRAPADFGFSLSQLDATQHPLLSTFVASLDSARAMLQRLCETEAAVASRDAQIQRLTVELKDKERLIEDLRVKVDEREEMLVGRGRELDDTLGNLRAAGARIEQLNGENKVLLELSNQQAKEVAALQGELHVSKQRETDLNAQLAGSKARIKDLESQVMNTNAINAALGSQMRCLESDKVNLERAHHETEKRRLVEEVKIGELRSEAELLRKRLQVVCCESERTKGIIEGDLKQALIREKDLSDQLSAYQRELGDCKSEISRIKEQYAQSRQELESLRSENAKVSESLTILQSRLDFVTSNLKATTHGNHDLSTALQIARDQLDEQNRELEKVRTSAKESSISFSERIAALNTTIDSAHDELRSTQRALSDEQQKHHRLAATHTQLESHHQTLVLESKSASTRASDEVERLTTAIHESVLKGQAAAEVIRALEAKLKTSDNSLGERKKEVDERVKEVAALKKERDILQKSLEGAQHELANEAHERAKVEDLANTTLGELKTQEAELSKLRDSLVGASTVRREEVVDMQSEVLHARVEVETLKGQIEKLALERDEAMKGAEEFKEDQRKYVNELESKIRANEETMETMKAREEATEMQVVQLQDVRECNESLVAEMRALRAQMKAKEEKTKEYQRRTWAAEHNLRQAVEENVELRDAERIGELEQTLSFRNAMIKDLQNQLGQAVAENADIRRALMATASASGSAGGRKRVRMY